MIAPGFYDAIVPMVEAIAAEFGRRHHTHGADQADFSQELWCWILEHEEKVAEWLDPEQWEPTAGTKMLAKALRNECSDYGLDIKAQAVGYERRDLYHYSRGELKALLPVMFNPDAWDEPPQSDGRSTKAPSEGGNWLCTLADVAQAYSKLEESDRGLLAKFHRDGWTNKMMAEGQNVSESLMSYYHDRAVKRLSAALGGPAPKMREGDGRDPWRGRHAVSSATGRAITSRAYEDA